jgi:hypothetical protein
MNHFHHRSERSVIISDRTDGFRRQQEQSRAKALAPHAKGMLRQLVNERVWVAKFGLQTAVDLG